MKYETGDGRPETQNAQVSTVPMMVRKGSMVDLSTNRSDNEGAGMPNNALQPPTATRSAGQAGNGAFWPRRVSAIRSAC
jgi:hypothetical protein